MCSIIIANSHKWEYNVNMKLNKIILLYYTQHKVCLKVSASFIKYSFGKRCKCLYRVCHTHTASTRSHVYYKSISFCHIQFPLSQLFCGRVPPMLRSLSDGVSSLGSCWDRRDPRRSPHVHIAQFTQKQPILILGLFTCKYLLSLHKNALSFFLLPKCLRRPWAPLCLTYSVKAPDSRIAGTRQLITIDHPTVDDLHFFFYSCQNLKKGAQQTPNRDLFSNWLHRMIQQQCVPTEACFFSHSSLVLPARTRPIPAATFIWPANTQWHQRYFEALEEQMAHKKCVVFLFQLDDTEAKIVQIDRRSYVHFHFTDNTAKK